MKKNNKEESEKYEQLKLALKEDPIIYYLPRSNMQKKMDIERILYLVSRLN